MSDGGNIVLDDYYHSNFQGVKIAVREFYEIHVNFFLYEVPLGDAFLMKITDN